MTICLSGYSNRGAIISVLVASVLLLTVCDLVKEPGPGTNEKDPSKMKGSLQKWGTWVLNIDLVFFDFSV